MCAKTDKLPVWEGTGSALSVDCRGAKSGKAVTRGNDERRYLYCHRLAREEP